MLIHQEQGRALYDAVASGTKNYTRKADACHYDVIYKARFERVAAAVQTQWFKTSLIIGINMSEVIEVSSYHSE